MDKKNIEEAKEFIKQRLNAQLTAEHEVRREIEKSAKELVELCYKYNVPVKKFTFRYNNKIKAEAELILSKLRDRIHAILERISYYDWEEYEEDEYIDREIAGKTLTQRIGDYSGMLSKEVEANAVACKSQGMSKSGAIALVLGALLFPYKTKPFKEAVKEGGFSAKRLRDGGFTRGIGRSNVATNNFETLASFTVSDAWMHFYAEDAKKDGAIGFYSHRGSGYPCDICDDYVGFHTMEEYELPLHPHCCCYPVFVYSK